MTERASSLIERLARLVQTDAHRAGLKPTQWEALRYLARANRFSRSPGALTAYLGMTKGTVSQTLQALERKGLVEKHVSENDRRGVAIDLTEDGRALLANDPMTDLDASLADLPKAQRAQLEKALETLLTGMLAQRGGRPFGACKTCIHFRRKHKEGAPHYCGLLNAPLTAEDSEQICAEQEDAA